MITMTWMLYEEGRLTATWREDGAPARLPEYLRDESTAYSAQMRTRGLGTVRHWMRTLCRVACISAPVLMGTAARAQNEGSPAQGDARKEAAPLNRYEVGAQTTFILQHAFPFHSPYEGPNSFLSNNETEISDTYTIYLGDRLTKNLDVYFDPEMARGKGLSTTFGLAGYTNGDVIRNPALSQGAYPARYFGRHTVRTGKGETQVAPGENVIGGPAPAHRLVLWVGKLAATDMFDVNAYANSTRTQFMNWALINSAAYDYAADTRGYTRGVALEWIHPDWAIRVGSFQMPTFANGPVLATDLIHNRGDQIELEFHPHVLRKKPSPAIVRLLAYRNFAHMGNYRDALRQAQGKGKPPDITAVEMPGAVKYGFGLNFEQALGDDGATGVFGRFTWNDGRTESFAYTEADRMMCLGYQLAGTRWHRPQDHIAVALVQNDLAASHKDYLAAGGLGFILGDSRLNYGPERILETYYNYQVSRFVTLSLDYQGFVHPAYNADRGPVSVLSLRLHIER